MYTYYKHTHRQWWFQKQYIGSLDWTGHTTRLPPKLKTQHYNSILKLLYTLMVVYYITLLITSVFSLHIISSCDNNIITHPCFEMNIILINLKPHTCVWESRGQSLSINLVDLYQMSVALAGSSRDVSVCWHK